MKNERFKKFRKERELITPTFPLRGKCHEVTNEVFWGNTPHQSTQRVDSFPSRGSRKGARRATGMGSRELLTRGNLTGVRELITPTFPLRGKCHEVTNEVFWGNTPHQSAFADSFPSRGSRVRRGAVALGAAMAVVALGGFLGYARNDKLGVGEKVAYAAESSKTSIVNLDRQGNAANNFQTALVGDQSEYIYLGKNSAGSGAALWRVLSKNDNKYASGKILLWSDKQLTTSEYNPKYDNPNYAYWGTSEMRAKLNGGTYYTAVSTTTAMPTATATVAQSASWFSTWFAADEQSAISSSGTYTTDDWGLDTSLAQYEYVKTNVLNAADGVNGKYNQNTVKMTTGPAQYAATTSANGVNETVSGDKLFLLDYYDVNNTSYGFGDSGVTYAKLIDAGWTPSSTYYPGYYTGTGTAYNNKTSAYLKFTKDTGEVDWYWLRPAGRGSTVSSSALIVNSSGYVVNDNVTDTSGVRPALNFNPDSVIYATAASVASVGATATNVESATLTGGKPAYKTYVKTAAYKNFNAAANAAAAPKISNSGGVITVTKTGQTGKAVVLLADKSAAGSVKYQAQADFASGTATVTLPAGVNGADYQITVLLCDSLRGGNWTESVSGSYTQVGVTAPQGYERVYSGSCQWDSALENSAYTVSQISYTSAAVGSTAQLIANADTSKIIDAGTYVVTLKLNAGQIWTDGTEANKQLTIKITSQEITSFTPTVDYGKNEDGSTKQYYQGAGVAAFPALKVPAGWESKGSISWDAGQTLNATGAYNWTFTPNSANYKVKKGTAQITVTPVKVESISATLTGTKSVYTTTPLADLLARIQVVKTNNDGSSGGIANSSELQFAAGTKLITGDNLQLIIQLKADTTVNCTITIPKVLAVVATELEVSQNDSEALYTSTTENELKGRLTVRIKNNDGTYGKTLAANEYVFSGGYPLTDGVCHLEISYGADVTLKGTISLNVAVAAVKSVQLTGINVPSGVTLWEGAAAMTIKPYLIVKATLDDGHDTVKTLVETDGFSVNVVGGGNKLTAPQCGISVTYGGKTSNNYAITVTEVLVDSLTANYLQLGRTIYSSAQVADLQCATYLSVTAVFNNGSTDNLASGAYTVSLPVGGLTSENNTVTVTWKKNDTIKTTTFTVKVTDVAPSSLGASYRGSPNAENAPDDLKAGFSATLTYNDGSTKVLTADEFTIEVRPGDLHDGKLCAGVLGVTVRYSPSIIALVNVTVAKANIDMSAVKFEDKTAAVGGTYSLQVENLPEGVTVSYVYKGTTSPTPIEFSALNEEGYVVTAKFSHSSPNYNSIPDMTAKLKITDKKIYVKSGLSIRGDGVTVDGTKLTAGYCGESFVLVPTGVVTDPSGAEVEPTSVTVTFKKGTEEVTELKNSGAYTVIVTYVMPAVGVHADYEAKFELRYTLTINKADFDMSGITFTDETFNYDGEAHFISVKGNLPDWVTIVYENNGKSTTGTYTVTAKFVHSNPNYNPIADKTAKIVIGADAYKKDFAYENLTVIYDGNKHMVVTPQIPDWLTARAYVNGILFTGATNAGVYNITVKFTHSNPAYGAVSDETVKLTINKAEVLLPTYKGNYTYTGKNITVKSTDFDGFNRKALTLETCTGKDVGEYSAQFTLTDPDNYVWHVGHESGEVKWQIGKATLSATIPTDKEPKWNFDDDVLKGVVTYTYYSDPECTTEVKAEDRVEGQKYYVKAAFSEDAKKNFDIDEATLESVFHNTFDVVYVKPAVPADGAADGGFLQKYWVYIAIAIGALLLLCVLIIAIKRRRAAYADDYDDEGEDEEYYEEEEYEE